jgi:hypothetical protein
MRRGLYALFFSSRAVYSYRSSNGFVIFAVLITQYVLSALYTCTSHGPTSGSRTHVRVKRPWPGRGSTNISFYGLFKFLPQFLRTFSNSYPCWYWQEGILPLVFTENLLTHTLTDCCCADFEVTWHTRKLPNSKIRTRNIYQSHVNIIKVMEVLMVCRKYVSIRLHSRDQNVLKRLCCWDRWPFVDCQVIPRMKTVRISTSLRR